MRSVKQVKKMMVPAYCIEEGHGLILVYGEKTALAGMGSLWVNVGSECTRVVGVRLDLHEQGSPPF